MISRFWRLEAIIDALLISKPPKKPQEADRENNHKTNKSTKHATFFGGPVLIANQIEIVINMCSHVLSFPPFLLEFVNIIMLRE